MKFFKHKLSDVQSKNIGENTKICFCGDARQSDLNKANERNGIVDFMSTCMAQIFSF